MMRTKHPFAIETNINDRGKVLLNHVLKILLVALVFPVLYFASATAARADVSECTGVGDNRDIRMQHVTYVPSFNSTSTDPRADKEINNGQVNYRVKLNGWLYYPSGIVGRRPVIIFNHGHAQNRPEPCTIAKYFVEKGFIVFAPLRRGHKSATHPAFHSTGVHIDTFTDKCMREARSQPYPVLPQLYTGSLYCREGVVFPDFIRRNAFEVDYIRSQHEDVREQVRFINEQDGTSYPIIADPTRIAVLGHSWGGSLAIFANEYDYDQNVVIDVSGAELSWSNQDPWWEFDLKDAMNDQKRPMYFLQPKNGLSLAPTKVLFGKAVNKEYRSQAAIFPKAPWDPEKRDEDGVLVSEAKQAHETFIGRFDDIKMIEIWGPSVIDFINRHPRQPPPQ